jgi:hypothetical protein
MSVLKSQLIPEKYRTTIMNFFRIPISLISIIALVGTEFISTYQICLICFMLMVFSTFLNIILIMNYIPPEFIVKREVKRKSDFMEIWNLSASVKNKIFSK